LYLSQHPLAAYDDFLKDKTTPLKNIKPTDDGKAAVVGGAINDAREITTKNGQKMAFVKLEDRSGEIELVVFPSIYQQTEDVWVRDHVVLVHGKVSSRDRSGQEGGGEAKILVDQAREITHEEADTIEASKPEDPKSEPKPVSHNPRIYIRLESSDDPKVLLSLKNTLDNFSGTTDVVLVMGPEQSKQAIKLPSGVSSEENVLQSLQDLVGASNVRVR
jgi:DNA polymerase-3 subunit alpha